MREWIVTSGLDKTCVGRPAVVDGGGFEGSKSKNDNKLSRTSTAAKPAFDALEKPNVQASPAQIPLPSGLINLGNLCFLDATLQALLSCPLFFQLLQDLVNCSSV